LKAQKYLLATPRGLKEKLGAAPLNNYSACDMVRATVAVGVAYWAHNWVGCVYWQC